MNAIARQKHYLDDLTFQTSSVKTVFLVTLFERVKRTLKISSRQSVFITLFRFQLMHVMTTQTIHPRPNVSILQSNIFFNIITLILVSIINTIIYHLKKIASARQHFHTPVYSVYISSRPGKLLELSISVTYIKKNDFTNIDPNPKPNV